METKPANLDRRIVAGLLLILAGGLLLLDQVDLIPIDIRHYLISWRTLLIGIGLITLSNRENRTTGFILIGLGILFWLPEMVDYRIRLSAVFWPAVLIGIGLIILTRRGNIDESASNQNRVFGSNKNGAVNADEVIDELAIFGGGNTKVTSTNFRGGKITAIFGGTDIEMKSAIPSPEGCTIDAFVLFGGSKLVVPDDWYVKSEVVSIFGGFSDKRMTAPVQNTSKMLVIKGVVIFGGVELKSY